MKQLTKFLTAAFVAAALVACTGAKKQSNEPVKTAKDTLAWSGTYEGVMPAADCPGIYTLLALNNDGNYEMYQKYLERNSSYVSKGELEWNVSGDTLFLLSNERMPLQVSKDALMNGNITLSRVSDKDNLEDAYTKYLIKEDKSGDNYLVEIYTEGNTTYAEFEFNNQKYKLKQDMDDSQMYKFTDAAASLNWNILDPAPMANYKPTLTLDGKVYTFSMLSPTNEVLSTSDSNAPVKGFDVLYMNNEGKSFVKLLSSQVNHCYTLPQIEASAKTAVYEKDGVEWSTDNKKGAVLIIDGKEYKYKEMALKK